MKALNIHAVEISKSISFYLSKNFVISLSLFLGFFCAPIWKCNAQNSADARPGQLTMTPDASALFKSTDIPVNLSTGVPNISIPIYTIELNGFNLPIGLSYNSSGLRVDEISSNVGLGWSLQAGGMISSAVNGMPDFSNNGYLVSSPSFPVDRNLQPYKYLLPNGEYTSNEDYDILFEASGSPKLEYISASPISNSSAAKDTQPDLFYYSIGDLSGKFFMNQSLEVFTVPFKPIHIQFLSDGGFIIIDESGNLFEFLETETMQIETSVFTAHPEFGGGSNTVENTNFLISKIVTTLGDEIVFEYENMSYSYSNAPFYSRYRLIGSSNFNILNPNITYWPLNTEVRYETTNYIFGKRLKKIISSSNIEVSFDYASCVRLDLSKTPNQTGAFALEGVSIKKDEQTQRINFVQDYINFIGTDLCTATINEDSYRLRLKEVHLPGKPPYKFEYFGGNNMPPRSSESKDHWGYYSSFGGRYFHEPQYGFTDQSKEPSLEGTLQGVLNKIQYPTGGYSMLEYELNQVLDTFSIHNVSIEQKVAAIYYDDQETGVRNITFDLDQDYDFGSLFIRYNTTQGPAQEGFSFDVSLSGPNNYFGQFLSSQGNDLQFLSLPPGTYTISVNQQGIFEEGYAQVFWTLTTTESEEIIGEIPLGGLRVKQVNNYDDFNDQPVSVKRYRYVNENGVSSGRVVNRPVYSNSISKFSKDYDENFFIVSVHEISYRVQNSTSVLPLSGMNGYHVMYTEVKEYQIGSNDNGFTVHNFSYANDFHPMNDYPQIKNLSMDWKRGIPVETKIYSYNEEASGYRLTKKISNKYKFNDVYQDEAITYFNPFFTPSFPNENHILLFNVECLVPEIKVNSFNLTQQFLPAQFQINISKMISAWYYLESTTEEEFDPSGTTTFSLETKYYYDNPEHAQLSRKENILSDGNIIKEFTLYPLDFSDNTGFVSQLKTNKIINKPIEAVQLKDYGAKQVVLGGSVFTYKNTGKGLVDKVFSLEGENIDLANFKFSNSQVGQLPEGLSAGIFLMDNKYQEKMEISMYNSKGNPLQVKASNGMVMSYLWSHREQLPTAKATNASWSEIAHTSFEADDKGGWNYSDNKQNSVKAKTGNYYYNLSSGQISRSGIGATPNKPYKLSFWARSSSGTTNWLFMGQTESLNSEWRLIERVVDGNSVTIVGSNILIDELRLHPIEAFMETYTHKPEIGIQSKTDENNRTIYFEYDVFGRLVGLKDEDGNLVKEHEYHYKGQ